MRIRQEKLEFSDVQDYTKSYIWGHISLESSLKGSKLRIKAKKTLIYVSDGKF